MRQLRSFMSRIAGLFSGRRADADLEEELQAHLEMETEENIRRGMAPEEARRQALMASGGLTQGAEAVRDGIARTIATLPAQLRRSLTWDQGAEIWKLAERPGSHSHVWYDGADLS